MLKRAYDNYYLKKSTMHLLEDTATDEFILVGVNGELLRYKEGKYDSVNQRKNCTFKSLYEYPNMHELNRIEEVLKRLKYSFDEVKKIMANPDLGKILCPCGYPNSFNTSTTCEYCGEEIR